MYKQSDIIHISSHSFSYTWICLSTTWHHDSS